MPFQWERPPEQALGELADAYATNVHRGVVRIAERYTAEIEAWMKTNAPWTDRTTQARTTLHSEVIDLTNEAVVIILGHGVEYGVFLELANAGRFSVIFPAMDHFLPRIWRDIQAMLDGMARGRFVSG